MHILLVEDNPGDVRLTREALRDDHTNHLTWTADGSPACTAKANTPMRRGPILSCST
jgi:CheY-like chemotaxis protein